VGVDNALAWYAERVLQYHGVTVALELEGDVGKLARERESALYRVVEDVLGEVTARPDYAHARVYLQAEEEAITLQVARTFNDPGTKPAVAPWLPALLAERMQAVGGSARLMQDEHGLTAIARLPLAEAAR
jgi:signal transduction histidine kinase